MDAVFAVLRVILSLAVVVGLLWMVQRRLTKGSKSVRNAKLVRVVTRQGIAQKASVVVIDVEGHRFLLGVTEHSVTVLNTTELPAEVTVSEPVSAPGSAAAFGTALATAKKTALPTGMPSFDPRTGQPRVSALDGSLLSLNTWKRAASAVRSGLK
ncbi:FliO/MopB family protein [Lacisediminihabitans changchengi]|uniref:Flagellar biosynthetic protein FliO n=1 Tax=Lacisediminihabitans changchengi TaxID=2787634 RepID=A0A934SNA2_9MICO|nr:flagellar biosynthetic protein FliO [Lacisediminihabitans changchengi]MBK4348673.1 flagellar biosynthetic protein FliO [Lacisediminihabitans changchengi]